MSPADRRKRTNAPSSTQFYRSFRKIFGIFVCFWIELLLLMKEHVLFFKNSRDLLEKMMLEIQQVVHHALRHSTGLLEVYNCRVTVILRIGKDRLQ